MFAQRKMPKGSLLAVTPWFEDTRILTHCKAKIHVQVLMQTYVCTAFGVGVGWGGGLLRPTSYSMPPEACSSCMSADILRIYLLLYIIIQFCTRAWWSISLKVAFCEALKTVGLNSR